MPATKPSSYRARKIDQGVERTIQVDGITYHYWDQGDGPALLVLHGFGGSAYDWHLHIDDLAAAGFRVIIPDLPGAGYTDCTHNQDYSITSLVRCVAAFAETLGLATFHLMGSSFGGGIALRIAVEYPDRVDRLVLFDAASMYQRLPGHVRILRRPILSKLATRIPPRTFLVGRLMKEIYHDKNKIRPEDIAEYAHEMAFPGVDSAMEKLARAVDMEEVREYSVRYRTLQLPTLIFWGEKDSIIPFHVGQALHKEIPGSIFHPIPDCGHCPHMEYPQETLRKTIAFLKEKTVLPSGNRWIRAPHSSSKSLQ